MSLCVTPSGLVITVRRSYSAGGAPARMGASTGLRMAPGRSTTSVAVAAPRWDRRRADRPAGAAASSSSGTTSMVKPVVPGSTPNSSSTGADHRRSSVDGS